MIITMSGTPNGGRKARQKLYDKYGKDYFRNIGRKGGQNGNQGGFADLRIGKDGLTGPERARYFGAKSKPTTHQKLAKNRKTYKLEQEEVRLK